MGIINDMATMGGGRVVIIADSIKLEGKNEKISANGYPLQNSSIITKNGGSGGFIYIKVNHRFNRSSIETGSRIQANGGFGTNGGLGGAGGVIVYEKLTFTSEYVTAQPG
jgi:hypothetical protein